MNSNHAIGFLFERTTRIIKLRFHQLFKEHDINISPEQWVVLDILYPNNVLSQKEIVAQSFKDAPSISRILLKLINNGYIDKNVDEIDKRLFRIQLTDKGREIVTLLNPKVVELRNIGLNDFEEDEITNLLNSINKIFENYSK